MIKKNLYWLCTVNRRLIQKDWYCRVNKNELILTMLKIHFLSFQMQNTSSLSIDYAMKLESLSLLRHSKAQHLPPLVQKDRPVLPLVGKYLTEIYTGKKFTTYISSNCNNHLSSTYIIHVYLLSQLKYMYAEKLDSLA